MPFLCLCFHIIAVLLLFQEHISQKKRYSYPLIRMKSNFKSIHLGLFSSAVLRKKQFFFSLISLFFCLPLVLSASNEHDARNQNLEEQLELLLPGTSLQAQSARMYASQRLSSFFDLLEKKKITKKKESKAYAIIEQEVARHFLQTHQTYSQIDELFKSGVYDASTAAVLYSIIFDYYQLPYSIVLKATAVHLYKGNAETAQPLSIAGTQQLDEQEYRAFQMNYTNLLRQAKLLKTAEWHDSAQDLYERYYLGKARTYGLEDAVSFMHYRYALKAYQDQAWMVCLERLNAARSVKVFPLYAMFERLVWLQLANDETRKGQSTYYLWKLWDYQANDALQSDLLLRFHEDVMDLQPMSQWAMDSIFNAYNDRFEGHATAQEQLLAINYLLQARFFASHGRRVQVTNFMDSLYQMRPNDQGVQQMLGGILAWSLKEVKDYNEGIEKIASLEAKYPFLKQDQHFQDRHLRYQSERIRDAYDGDKGRAGDNYLQSFEPLIEKATAIKNKVSYVTTAYLCASNYYFRAKNYAKALSLIEKGLSLAPDDAFLQHRTDLLRRY